MGIPEPLAFPAIMAEFFGSVALILGSPARSAALAIALAAVILVGGFGGHSIDRWLGKKLAPRTTA